MDAVRELSIGKLSIGKLSIRGLASCFGMCSLSAKPLLLL
jgi:hypothetical protein